MKLQSLPAALVLIAALVVCGILVGLDKPLPAALSAAVGLIVQSCLPAVLGSSAPPAAKAPPGVAVLAMLALALPLVACSAGAQATASSIIGDIGAASPLVCAVVDSADPAGASVCGTATSDVSAVAKLVQGIIASLPKAARADAAPMPAELVYHHTVIHLPPGVDAAAVAKALP